MPYFGTRLGTWCTKVGFLRVVRNLDRWTKAQVLRSRKSAGGRMNQRTIESLRRLAERPGTEYEGIVAREMLAKLEAKAPRSFADALRNHSLPSFEEILRKHGVPTEVTCPCGQSRKIFSGPCTNYENHAEIAIKIRETFSRGDRVFYNYWAYPPNCPGVVAKHVPLGRENGTFPWGWVSVRFDHLRNARRVPIINDKGEWCLTKERK